VPFSGQVLGIDPSLRGTGLALVDFAPGRSPVLLRCQTLRVPARVPMSGALAEIHRAVTSFIADFSAALFNFASYPSNSIGLRDKTPAPNSTNVFSSAMYPTRSAGSIL
jgi:hypothetical protein